MSSANPTEETFIRLAALLRDDKELHQFFKNLETLDNLERNLKLTEMIESMKKNSAQEQMIEACMLLRKKEIFIKLGKLIDSKAE